jgi:hypothetical protein
MLGDLEGLQVEKHDLPGKGHFRFLNWSYLPDMVYVRPKLQGISLENMAKHMVQ